MDKTPKYRITLTREELILISQIGKIPPIPGIGEEPLGELTPEQKAIGMIYAERSLRARGLASISSEGKLRVARDLLKTIWLCGNSQVVISIMTVNGKVAYRSFLYSNSTGSVLHRPNSSLHELDLFGSFKDAIAFFTPMLNWPSSKPEANMVTNVSENLLLNLKKKIEQNQQSRVYRDLIKENVTTKVAKGFSDFISKDFTNTFIQIGRYKKDDLLLRNITVLNNETEMWGLIEKSPSQAENSREFVLGNLSKDGILKIVNQEVEMAN